MNLEQQRIAIAEACGWKKGDLRPSWCHPDNWSMAKNGSHEVWVSQDKLPNYLNDLNAMHEAEKALGLSYDRWTRELRAICERDRRCIESATASQRAEAFLRTIGKWKESK